MNAKRLLEVYEQISEAPDAIAHLRRFVLDLAVRGKLVEQDRADETAKVLLGKIASEKESAGIKKSRARKSAASDAKVASSLFDLPESWAWTSLAGVSHQIHYGYTASADPSEKNVRLLRITDIQNDKVEWDTVPGCVLDDATYKKYALKTHDLLIARTGGTIGKTFLVNEAPVKSVFASYLIRVQPTAAISAKYIKLFCGSETYWEQLRDGSRGGGQPNVNGQTLGRLQMPLPPLAEQHRIVAKVDELMALCDRLKEACKTREKTRDELTAASLARLTAPDTTPEDFPAHARFALNTLPALTSRPDQIKTLRQNILNLAVNGKLVKQDPVDEPAAELLERIDAAHPKKKSGLSNLAASPQLANGWVAARLDEIAIFENGDRSSNYPSGPDIKPEGIAFFSTKNLSDHRLHFRNLDFITNEKFESLRSGKLQDQDILITLRGSVGKFGLFEATEAIGTGFINAQLMIIRSVEPALVPFLITFMKSGVFSEQVVRLSSGSATPQLSGGKLSEAEIWLPPLAEQRRIVAKVDALMALCDQMESALTSADTTRTRLLEALLHEALNPSEKELEAAE
ncbi:restriction endonuclease subunit S [Shimia thalassica]|uniref:restriction endonuclease subunit S n=1 Tax=Shimia thalassica TaxID=1715693 RepID=UPI001C089AAE|nr:restriction endonuclease subunit S [Shimia thalassica]MBU2942931.1 restriction endonuclease subunit S [Shimia thalassica]MDO6502746.1 restriction endonuclease subunit S [Shimia thalassica]